MNKSTKFLTAASVVLLGLTTTAEASTKQEKCFGIVKAGKNDCAAADESHSCATYSKKDGESTDWIMLPEGTCTRILGASTEPKR